MPNWINDSIRLKVDVTYILQIKGGFAVGSGFRRGLLHKAVLRDGNQKPLLPASMIKGRTRDVAERLALMLGIYTCNSAPAPEEMCGTKPANAPPCLVCRTFGTPGRSSNSLETGLIWRDPILLTENDQSYTESLEIDSLFCQRTHVQLSRHRGVAMEMHLFNEETARENLQFQGRIRGWLTVVRDTDAPYPEEVIFLLTALKLVNFVGGGKSHGLGQCSVILKNIDMGEKTNLKAEELLLSCENWFKLVRAVT